MKLIYGFWPLRRKGSTKNELAILRFLLERGPNNLYRISRGTDIRFSSVHLIVNRLSRAGLVWKYKTKRFEKTGKITVDYGLTWTGIYVLMKKEGASHMLNILEKITINHSKFPSQDVIFPPLNPILKKIEFFKKHGILDIFLATFYKMLADWVHSSRFQDDSNSIEIISSLLSERLETKSLHFVGKEDISKYLVVTKHINLFEYFIRKFIEVTQYIPELTSEELKEWISIISLDEDLSKAFTNYLKSEQTFLEGRLNALHNLMKIV